MERDQLTRAYNLALDHLAEFDSDLGFDADYLREFVDLDMTASGDALDRLSDDQKVRVAAVALDHVVTDHSEQVFNEQAEAEVFVMSVGRSSDVGPTVTYGILVHGDNGDVVDEQVTVEIATRDARLAAEIDLLIEALRPQPKPFLSARFFTDEEQARLLRRPCTREYVRLRSALAGSPAGSQRVGLHCRSRPRERQTRRSTRSSRGAPSRSRSDDESDPDELAAPVGAA